MENPVPDRGHPRAEGPLVTAPSQSRTARCSVGQLVLQLRQSRKTILQIAQELKLDRSRVARVRRRHGLSRLRALEPVQPVRRYEWARPGDMLHLDVKKLVRVRGLGHRVTGIRTHTNKGIGWEYVHVCIDDATRVAFVEVLENERGPTTAGFLERAVAFFRDLGIRTRRVLTDNGPGYLSKAFSQACARSRARHRRTRPYTPRTNGKAERFIQSLLRECAYARPYESSPRAPKGAARMDPALQRAPPTQRAGHYSACQASFPLWDNVLTLHI
jgi:transposase InsO family protein